MKTAIVLASLLLSAQVVGAQSVPSRIWHFAGHHKELLAADAVVVLAEAADSASSVHCQRLPGCTETSPLLSSHPSELSTWSLSMGYAAGLVVLNGLLCKVAPSAKHVIWFDAAGIAVLQTFNVASNVNTAEGLQNARNRVGHE